jgi:hypothetical protein
MGRLSDLNVDSPQNLQSVFNPSIYDFHSDGTMIVFNVTSKEGTTGFCRVCIPTASVGGTYTSFVDGREIPYVLLPYINTHLVILLQLPPLNTK